MAIVLTVVVIALLGLFVVGGVFIGKGKDQVSLTPVISVLDTTLDRPEENPVISSPPCETSKIRTP